MIILIGLLFILVSLYFCLCWRSGGDDVAVQAQDESQVKGPTSGLVAFCRRPAFCCVQNGWPDYGFVDQFLEPCR